MELKVIATIRTDFPSKFGIPRQSGLANTRGTIIFEPEFRKEDMLKGIEDFSHLWLIWGFSEHYEKGWSPTVRPPRLGGNDRKGVFATRSPFRPNPLGLSCVEIMGSEHTRDCGTVLHVSGADMLDNTPIYDIKPYLPYVESHPDAKGGFAEEKKEYQLNVVISEEWQKSLPEEQLTTIQQILSQDPRPAYQNDPNRIYGMEYMDYDIRFQIDGNDLTVCEVCKIK